MPISVGLDAIWQRIDQLGLLHAGEQIDTLVNDSVKRNTATHLFVEQLLDTEPDRREERRPQTSLYLFVVLQSRERSEQVSDLGFARLVTILSSCFCRETAKEITDIIAE